ncbi:hypothetical protein FA707_01550 [Vagococcus zengguangii]|uniref:Type II secretion system protein n=2 Tax=Vagococcus zengguangii TaxID=2571750 RepID=A0A4D7CTI5_9ENTE|nr:hypothetical protein FA707_01550 [Vagococcus zengguangii]
MLVVLMVASVMVTLPVLSYQKWQQKISNQQVISDFENGYYRTQLSAIQVSKRSYIYLEKAGCVTFVYFDLDENQRTEVIEWPASIKTSDEATITFLANSGGVTKALTYSLVDSLNEIKIIYTIQLGSGKLVKKIESL